MLIEISNKEHKIKINGIVDTIFTSRLNDDEVHEYHFIDKSISKSCFEIYDEGHFIDNNLHSYEYYFMEITDESEFRTYVLEIYLDEVRGYLGGQFSMEEDYKMSDSGCMLLYNLGLDVCYNNPDQVEPEEYIYYDKEAILRRQTIQNIVEHD